MKTSKEEYLKGVAKKVEKSKDCKTKKAVLADIKVKQETKTLTK